MKRKFKKLFANKITRYLIIPLLLFSLWMGLTGLYVITFDKSISVLSYIHGRENFSNISYGKLLKGQKITGQFVGVENNLGILSVKFQTFIKPSFDNEDILVFRIKEKGQKKWYYENEYRSGSIYGISVFPFGFPKIANSQGKNYYFEIESLGGNNDNSVALSSKGDILFSKYQVPKSIILSNRNAFAEFWYKKIINLAMASDIRFASFIYLLPLILYLLWISPFKKHTVGPVANILSKFINKKIAKSQSPSLSSIRYLIVYNFHFVIIAVVLADVFIVQLRNDPVYLVVVALWTIIIKKHRMTSSMTFVFGLLLIIVASVFSQFKDFPTSEKAAIWSYLFLSVGLIQIILEVKSKKRSNIKE